MYGRGTYVCVQDGVRIVCMVGGHMCVYLYDGLRIVCMVGGHVCVCKME